MWLIKWANGCGESFEDRRRLPRNAMENNSFHCGLLGRAERFFCKETLEKESTAVAAK